MKCKYSDVPIILTVSDLTAVADHCAVPTTVIQLLICHFRSLCLETNLNVRLVLRLSGGTLKYKS